MNYQNHSTLTYSCPLCMITTYYKDNIQMYFGDPCGHHFCSQCSNKVNKKSIGIKGNTDICPVCHTFVKYIIDYEYGETQFLKQENNARKQVYSIMNETRIDFKDTPSYNNFLEKREDLIYKLIYGNDQEKKSTQEFLNQHSKEYQIDILNRKTRQETQLKNSIREIVKEEGTFYEQLNQLTQNTSIDHIQIVHPLQNEYPEFFQNYTNSISKNSQNNSINILGTDIPNPIDKSITSRDQINYNINTSVESRQRAGGFTENIVWNLCKNELFFGFYSPNLIKQSNKYQ